MKLPKMIGRLRVWGIKHTLVDLGNTCLFQAHGRNSMNFPLAHSRAPRVCTFWPVSWEQTSPGAGILSRHKRPGSGFGCSKSRNSKNGLPWVDTWVPKCGPALGPDRFIWSHRHFSHRLPISPKARRPEGEVSCPMPEARLERLRRCAEVEHLPPSLDLVIRGLWGLNSDKNMLLFSG